MTEPFPITATKVVCLLVCCSEKVLDVTKRGLLTELFLSTIKSQQPSIEQTWVNRQKVRSLCIKNPGIFGKKITFLISFPQEASSHRVDGSIVQYGWFCVGLHHNTPPNSIWARRYSSSKTIGRVRFLISQRNSIVSITWISLDFHTLPTSNAPISELRWS